MERLRPRRGLATPVFAIAFAAVAAMYMIGYLQVGSLDPVAAGSVWVAAILVGYPSVAIVASCTTLGEAAAEWPYGPVLVRPPRAAVALVALSLCLSGAWVVVDPGTFTVVGSLAPIVSLPLYLPLYLLYLGVLAVTVLATDSGIALTPGVHVLIFAVGGALSAVWQLLLASALLHRLGDAGGSAVEADSEPRRGRK